MEGVEGNWNIMEGIKSEAFNRMRGAW